MPDHNTDEWRISATIDFVPKAIKEEVECDHCNGRGSVGGGFHSMTEKEPCDWCGGTGRKTILKRPYSMKPDVPQVLIDHMRKAYLEYKLK